MNARIHQVDGVEIASAAFGDPADPALLLLHGAGHSMVAWPPELVEALAAAGRYVIVRDARDAGRSSTYPIGAPGYGLRDLVTDVVAVLDDYGIDRAHVLGMSQGAAVAQLVAVEHPDRVASVILASSTPGGPGHATPDLPGFSDELSELFATEQPTPDWSNQAAVVAYLVDAERPFAGRSRPFDEAEVQAAAQRMAAHARDIAAQTTNPYLIDDGEPWRQRLGDITVPALVVHGAEDPMFPIEHGRALAAEIPGARLLELAHTGHEIFPRMHWDTVIAALVDLTA